MIPFYPGYDFSDRPARSMGPRAVAFLFDKLMTRLGYDRYRMHGRDWGAHITSLLGFHLLHRVIGIHSPQLWHCARQGLSSFRVRSRIVPVLRKKPLWPLSARSGNEKGAYSQLQATRPAKLGYAMMDSPVGLAAWSVEAFHAWSDRRSRSFEQLFTFEFSS